MAWTIQPISSETLAAYSDRGIVLRVKYRLVVARMSEPTSPTYGRVPNGGQEFPKKQESSRIAFAPHEERSYRQRFWSFGDSVLVTPRAKASSAWINSIQPLGEGFNASWVNQRF